MNLNTDTARDAATTIVVLDPTSPTGEAGVDYVGEQGDGITLLLFLDDPSARAIRQFALAENMSVSEASGRYLDQVCARFASHVDEAVSTVTADPVAEILDLVERRRAKTIVVPPTLPGLGGAGLQRLIAASTVPVVVAPPLAA